MGGIVSTITDAIGLTDHEGQERAMNNAAAAARDANALSKENLEFQRQQYEDWESVYGDLQENLGNYFKNLGPERVASLGLQQQQKAYQETQEKIRTSMAQRGLGDSKFEAYAQNMADMNNSYSRANIRVAAEDQVKQQQLNFLGLGLNQGIKMLDGVNSAANLGVSSYSNQANMYNNQFSELSRNNSSMIRQVFDAGAEVVGADTGYEALAEMLAKKYEL